MMKCGQGIGPSPAESVLTLAGLVRCCAATVLLIWSYVAASSICLFKFPDASITAAADTQNGALPPFLVSASVGEAPRILALSSPAKAKITTTRRTLPPRVELESLCKVLQTHCSVGKRSTGGGVTAPGGTSVRYAPRAGRGRSRPRGGCRLRSGPPRR